MQSVQRSRVTPEPGRMSHPNRVFLSAEWRDLAMLNYEVNPALLEPRVPPGKVLDDLGIERYCCRRMLLSHVEIVDTLRRYQ